jgi:dimethylamine/trimethylamine dehydrogenase
MRVADWRIGQIAKMPNVTTFKLNRLSAGDIFELEHDHVVLATGATWRRDGVGPSNRSALHMEEGASVFTPDDLMRGRFPVQGPVIVFDDDQFYMGGVLAELLSRRGLEVRLVTPGHTVSKHTEASLEIAQVIKRMRELHVRLSVNMNVTQVSAEAVTLQCLLSGETETRPAAAIVLVTAREPDDALYQQLIADPDRLVARRIRSVTAVGDAKLPDTIAAAVFSGHRYAREFEAAAIDVAQLAPSIRCLY